MNDIKPQLDWIDGRAGAMRDELIELCEINSHSYNTAGIDRVLDRVQERLAPISDRVARVPIANAPVMDDRGQRSEAPLAPVLIASRRADAPYRVLLNIHADTVYPVDSAFQKIRAVDANTLIGPGVVDAKGGIVVMLTALEAFEQTPLAKHIGWEVIINTDEEIGSPGSNPILDEAAKRNQVGLLFEPALGAGALVSRRRGSGTYTILVRGRAAHAGRDFANGRNAVVLAGEMAVKLHEANRSLGNATINVGKLNGGTATNVVPDLAMIQINVRADVPEDVARIEEVIRTVHDSVKHRDGFSIEVAGRFSSMPKVLDVPTQRLLDLILDAGRSIGLNLTHGPSGGASDGNRLSAAGLPNIDSMGPRGGELHSEREFIHLDSLAERAKLSLAVLARLAGRLGTTDEKVEHG